MSETAGVLRDVYAVLAELWCSPEDVDEQEITRAADEAVTEWEALDPEGAASLARFLRVPVSGEQYVELFELAPRCPLYLGSHAFEEPRTCAQAGVSDRNKYMIELLGIYRHLGLAPKVPELPDHIPLVVEFLSLSAGSDDPIREKLVQEYVLPYLPPIRARLEALKTSYVDLLDALERALKLDLEAGARGRLCLTTSSS